MQGNKWDIVFLKAGRIRWHPDKLARMDEVTQNMGRDMFRVIQYLSEEVKKQECEGHR